MKFAQVISYYKRKKFIETLCKNWDLKTSSRPFLCLKRSKHNIYWKNEILKQATYIRYVIANLSTYRPPQVLFYRGFFENHFSYSFLINIFLLQYYIKWPDFITRLCLLPKSFSEICFVSCLGIWWRHDICIAEKIKFHYLKNEKSFRSEVKNIFPCFTGAVL